MNEPRKPVNQEWLEALTASQMQELAHAAPQPPLSFDEFKKLCDHKQEPEVANWESAFSAGVIFGVAWVGALYFLVQWVKP